MDTKTLAFLFLLTFICGVTNSFLLNKDKEEQIRKYEVVCGSLNDYCRNMMDTYNLSDSIYNHYLDVIEEQGYNKLEVKNSYFSY